MTAVTVHLDEELVRETQAIVKARRGTMDEVVAEGLKLVSSQFKTEIPEIETAEMRRRRFDAAMARFSGFDIGSPTTRDEMNER